MIRTKQPQIIDAMNRREGIVYIKALNRTENEHAQTVSFEIEMYILKSVAKEETVRIDKENEAGEMYTSYERKIVTRNEWVFIGRRQAIYRMSTFYSIIGNVTPAQYDDVLIEQIDYINSRPLTGNEIQKDIYFWNLTASDLEKVTDEQLTELLTPSIEN